MPHREPAFSIQLDARAPKFLNARNKVIQPDPLKQAFDRVREAFSRLHGQRLMEVMRALFDEMPEGEKIWMDWARDEIDEFFLRFSNGWSLGQNTEDADEPCPWNWEHLNEQVAPKWFERTSTALDRWKNLHMLLHCYTINPEVDMLAHERLHALSQERDGLSARDLPLIESTLVGPVFGAGLDAVRLDETLDAPAPAKRGRASRM